MKINENLKVLRLSRNMTQEQVAEKINVTRQAVSSYESGRTRPDIDTLITLSEVYGTDLDAIIYGQQKELKDIRRIKHAARIVFAVLVALCLSGSLIYLVANSFFSISHINSFTGEAPVVWEIHWGLIEIWKVMDSLVLALSFVCFVVLLIMLIVGKGRIPIKTKLIYAGVLSASLLLTAVVCGLLDPQFSPREYILTPAYVTARLVVFLIADIVIEKIKYRKSK